MKDIWAAVKKRIEKRIPKNSYSLWIKPIQFLQKKGNTIYLGCPNKFSCKWISENYYSVIKDCFFEVTKERYEIKLKVIPRQKEDRSRSIYTPDQLFINDVFQAKGPRRIRLNQNFVFERFVVGPCNEFAYHASTEIAKSEEWRYGALFLLGETGLGKTHLSQAVGHWILNKDPEKRVIYVTAEDFMNELIYSIRRKQVDSFKERYRKACDVLLLEEVHFLSGKEKTQIELAHTIDSLINDGKKIIFTSSLPPNKIPRLSKELTSRFSSGLITPIDFPDYETRFKIVSQKSKEKKINLTEDIIDFLASKIKRDIRQIESIINYLKARSEMMKQKIDLDLVKEAVAHFVPEEEKIISLGEIMDIVCKHYRIDPDNLRSRSRKKIYTNARNIYVYLARKYTDKSITEIGKSINRAHSTVTYGLEKVKQGIKQNSEIKKQIEFLDKKINDIQKYV